MVRERRDDDVVIVRTAVTKAKRGGFGDTHPEVLLSAVLKGVCDRVKLPPSAVDDIVVGNVLPPGGGANVARMAMFHAGFPHKTTISTTNRQCSSGLQAIATVAAAIRSGFIEVGIGAGVESMTMHYGDAAMPASISEDVLGVEQAADCLIPMGITSENVAEEFGIGRERQDEFSAESHRRAFSAQQGGRFEEIIPVKNEAGAVISRDDGVRGDTTPKVLSRLRPSFKESGTTTAGNSSQVSDGAAAVLLMKRRTATVLGLPVLARFADFVVAGVPPRIMGIGPAVAIPQLLSRNRLSIDDIGVFEINEAFASQAVYCIEALGIPPSKVNPNGGAVAIGHPLGCTGARLVATLLPELRRRGARLGVVSMCIGSGMGAAALIESEQSGGAKSKL